MLLPNLNAASRPPKSSSAHKGLIMDAPSGMRASGKNPTTLAMQQLVRVAVATATVTAKKAAIHDEMNDAAHALPQLNLDACALKPQRGN